MHKTSFSSMEEDMKSQDWTRAQDDRRAFIGGSDARIIMGDDEAALLRFWRERTARPAGGPFRQPHITQSSLVE